MTNFEEYLSDKTAIPPEPKEIGTKEVKVYCTVVTYLEVPKDLENYSEMKEYIENNYTESYILEDPDKVYIDDIEK